MYSFLKSDERARLFRRKLNCPRPAVSAFNLSYIRHHTNEGRDREWIAKRLDMTPHDVLMAILEMSNDHHQRESESQAEAVRPLPVQANAKPSTA